MCAYVSVRRVCKCTHMDGLKSALARTNNSLGTWLRVCVHHVHAYARVGVREIATSAPDLLA